MFGFFIGTALTLAIVGLVSRRAFRRRSRDRFFAWRLQRILDRVHADKQQRRAIEDIADELRAELDESRHQLRGTRLGVAELFRSDALDETDLDEAMAPGRAAFARASTAVLSALGRLHGVLSPEQRADLVEWLERRHTARAHA